MAKYCYLNGRIVQEVKASISVNDIGLLRGYGIFDFLRSYDGKPFILDRHLARFEKSAELLNLKIPASREKIEGAVISLLKKNKLPNAGIKLVLTGGISEDGLSYDANKPTFYILTHPLPAYPKEYYENGVKVITFDRLREVPQAKTNNYITMIKLSDLKKKEKAVEIIYTADGLVLEGASSNFFVFRGDKLITPKENILSGTRRQIVVDLAKDKFKIEERDLKVSEVKDADEAFITSTTRDVMPVTRIDGYQVGDGKVGANTKILMRDYQEFIIRKTKITK